MGQTAEQRIEDENASHLTMLLAKEICDCGLVNPQVHWTRHGAECAFRLAMQDDTERHHRDEEADS